MIAFQHLIHIQQRMENKLEVADGRVWVFNQFLIKNADDPVGMGQALVCNHEPALDSKHLFLGETGTIGSSISTARFRAGKNGGLFRIVPARRGAQCLEIPYVLY